VSDPALTLTWDEYFGLQHVLDYTTGYVRFDLPEISRTLRLLADYLHERHFAQMVAPPVACCPWCPDGVALVRHHPSGQPEHRP
jgi:hypothetical protein